MAPINVISELFTPISMACRHFGNILSGTVISGLLYAALATASYALFGALGSSLVACAVVLVLGAALFASGKKDGKTAKKFLGIVLIVVGALGALTNLLPMLNSFPWLVVGLPAITSFYFDWFTGVIQAFIFCTLTTIFIKQAAGD